MVKSRALPEVFMVEVMELPGVVVGVSGTELEVFLVELRELFGLYVVELRALLLALLTEVYLKLDDML